MCSTWKRILSSPLPCGESNFPDPQRRALMPYYRCIAMRFLIGIIILVVAVTALRAQTQPCDSCATVADMLVRWEVTGVTADQFNIANGEGRILLDHVRRITRGTIYLDGLPRQGIRVLYGEHELCRDTMFLFDTPMSLRRE